LLTFNLFAKQRSAPVHNDAPAMDGGERRRQGEGSTRTRLRIAEDGLGKGREFSQKLYRWGSHGLKRSNNYILCTKRSATSPKSVWKSVARVSALRLGELNPLVWYSLDSRESSSPELMNG
jgi:hypothetical protein